MRRVCFVFVIFVLCMPWVLAVSTDIKESYRPSETMILEFSNDVSGTITREQVKLLRNGYIPAGVDYDIKKLGDRYYLWMTLPQNPGSYSLKIEDVISVVNGGLQIVDYKKNFLVQGDKIDYSISPGVVFTTKNFRITANLYGDSSITIESDFPSERNIALRPGVNNVDFSISGIEGIQIKRIVFGRYSVPVYIKGSEPAPPSQEEMPSEEETPVEENPSEEPPTEEPPSIPEEPAEENPAPEENERCLLSNPQWLNESGSEISSAIGWENKRTDGERVLLVMGGNEICGSGEVELKIYEHEEFSRAVFYKSLNVSIGKEGISFIAWRPDWFDDGFLQGDPEYYFVGKAPGENESGRSDLLKVYRPGEIILEEIEKVSNSFKFSHGAIRATALISSSPTSYQFEVINVGEGALTELLFSYNREIFSIEPRGNFFIEPNESAQFNLTIKNVTSTRIKDAIVAYSGDNSDYILIDINFTKEESEVEADYIEGGDAESSVYYCSELFGKICSGGEVCSGETASSIDGACCLEQCVKEKSESKAWIGYLIVGVIILILLIVYVKYKKTKPMPAQKEKGGF